MVSLTLSDVRLWIDLRDIFADWKDGLLYCSTLTATLFLEKNPSVIWIEYKVGYVQPNNLCNFGNQSGNQ